MTNRPTNVTTGKVRLSYANLFKPYTRPGSTQEPKFSTTILLPKADVFTKQRIDAAVQAAIDEGVGSKWGGVRPPQLHIPIHDGDGVRPSDGMPYGDECKGHWVFTASSNRQQAVVDINVNPIIDQSEVYSGMYARVNVNFFPYNSNGRKGVGCGLGPVQKIADGEPLGGGITAEQAFGTPVPQQQYAPPTQPTPLQYQTPQTPITQQQQPQQQQHPQQQQVQYDPITGAPINGGVMGI
ncbi:MAG: DUF2815 family protein [Firmicutes bacterium]|nr:DUF2815 family protein [Bacillota bacterium]